MDNELPFTNTVNVPGGNHKYRIPHGDQANWAAMDGSVRTMQRKHFGTGAGSSERPFTF